MMDLFAGVVEMNDIAREEPPFHAGVPDVKRMSRLRLIPYSIIAG
jgi:hypothetical protein